MTATQNQPMKAAALMVVAMTLIGFIDNFVQQIAGHIGLWQFHLLRSLLMLPLIYAMSKFGLGRIRPARLWPVVARSLVIGLSMLLYFGALSFMTIAEALAGLFTSPIFVLLINIVVMRQRVGLWRILAVAMGFAGILLVLQPGGDSFSPAMLMPMAGGLFYAIGAIATRSWCAEETALSLLTAVMVMLGAMGLAGLAGIALLQPDAAAGAEGFLTRGWVWPVSDVGWLLVLQAVGSLAGVFLIIRAYQLEEPSFVAVFEYTVMIAGPLFGWWLFGQGLGMLQALGILLIALAGVIIALRSR